MLYQFRSAAKKIAQTSILHLRELRRVRLLQPAKSTYALSHRSLLSSTSSGHLCLVELIHKEVCRVVQNLVQGYGGDVLVVKLQPLVAVFLLDIGCVMPAAGVVPEVCHSSDQVVLLRDASLSTLICQPLRIHPAYQHHIWKKVQIRVQGLLVTLAALVRHACGCEATIMASVLQT